MKGVLIDSNIILDIFEEDPNWLEWSESVLFQYSQTHILFINPVIYAEVSIGFQLIEDLERAVLGCGFKMIQIPKEALFLAGKVFLKYRQQKGIKKSILPDFFIGAHASVDNMVLITRDTRRYKIYYPKLKLISPE